MPRIAAAQTPDYREDIEAALACLNEMSDEARAQGADLLCFPEGFLQGYLTEAAAARRSALDLASPAFAAILARFPKAGPTLALGMIEAQGDRLFNTAIVVQGGVLVGRYRKTHLLRGEAMVFAPGTQAGVFEAGDLKFGINICYDTNFPQAAQLAADGGARLLVCLANNMLPRAIAEDWKDRHNPVRGQRCRETGMWLVSADVTGERDGRIGWGPTAVLNPEGEVVAQLPLDRPGLLVFDLPQA